MKKLKNLWLRIPRKKRIAINFLVILILAFSVYVFCGCPAFTARQKFRRAEKANLVGPGEILGVYELENFGAAYLVVADNGDTVSFYTSSNIPYAAENFVYRKKTGALTVLATPDYLTHTFLQGEVEIPVFLFDGYPEAARAELEFTLSTTLNDVYFEKDYLLESAREEDGFFHFTLPVTTREAESYAVQAFTALCGYRTTGYYSSQPITVRLYDENGDLILEKEVTIRAQALAARDQVTDPE